MGEDVHLGLAQDEMSPGTAECTLPTIQRGFINELKASQHQTTWREETITGSAQPRCHHVRSRNAERVDIRSSELSKQPKLLCSAANALGSYQRQRRYHRWKQGACTGHRRLEGVHHCVARHWEVAHLVGFGHCRGLLNPLQIL